MYRSLNSKFSNFEKTAAGKDSILKLLFGKSPSRATSEAADALITGSAANEALNDQISRNLASRIEEGRRRGALKGMLSGASTGFTAGGLAGAVVPRPRAALEAINNLHVKNPDYGVDELVSTVLEGSNPLAVLAGGGLGALGLGYAGKKVGAGMGRVRGLKKGLSDIPGITSRRLENEILKRM